MKTNHSSIQKLGIIFILTIIQLIPITSYTQSHEECGSHPEATTIENYLSKLPAIEAAEREYFDSAEERAVNFVPVQAHIVRLNDGSGGLTEAQLDQAISDANSVFIEANIQFFLCGDINYIDDSSLYSYNRNTEEGEMGAYNVDNVINIYFTNYISSGGVSICGYATFPDDAPQRDFIFMKNSCALNGSTIAHELGHYFNLFHTHSTINGQERVDGTNCDTAGDLLCDTPADPKLSYSTVNLNCVYTGIATDTVGDEYAPDPINLMSYSRKECRDYLSPQQTFRALYALQNDRSYLSCEDIGYCEPGGNYSSFYIKSAEINETSFSNGNSSPYVNSIDKSAVVQKGSPFYVFLRFPTLEDGYTARTRIWIDYNQDGDFNDSGEVVSWGTNIPDDYQNPYAGALITIPETALPGHTRIRIGAKKNGSYPSACGNNSGTEIEDYTLYIEEGYCSIQTTSTAYEWIHKVTFGDIYAVTNGPGPNGYSDITHKSTVVNPGENYALTLSPGFVGDNIYSEYWAVWIDYNQDGDFEDEDEMAYQSLSAIEGGLTVQIDIPDDANTGSTRMRIAMKYGSPITSSCTNYYYGEVEDYTLIIQQEYCESEGDDSDYEWIDRVYCNSIDHITGNNGGYADYSHVSTSLQQGLGYLIYLVPGFENTSYDEVWRVWIDFNQDGDFNDANELAFESDPGGTPYSEVGYIHIPFSAKLGDTKMRVSMEWASQAPTTGVPCGEFDYGEVEDYTVSIMPMTVGSEETLGAGQPEPTMHFDPVILNTMNFKVYPNPTTGPATVAMSLSEEKEVELSIFNAIGQRVHYQPVEITDRIDYNFDLSTVPVGIYFLVVNINGRKFTKQISVVR